MNEYDSGGLQMENEYNTTDIPAPVQALPASANNEGRYYTETIKPKKTKKGGFIKFIAVAVICAVIAAPLLGLGIGAGQMLINTLLYGGAAKTASTSNEPVRAKEASVADENFTISNLAKINEANSLVGVIKSAESSVVNITTSIINQNQFYNFYFGGSQQSEGSGTGIIFKQDNDNVYIMTNYHVIEGASSAYISFSANEQIKATPVGANKAEDIAVIAVKKSDLAAEGIKTVSVAKMGDSSKLEVGEWVVAIGNAVGNGKTATFGIVSALDKQVTFENERNSSSRSSVNLIQTDAAINPGNSGGALVNMNGEVIGMNTAKLAGYSVEGMGFALPVNSIMGFVNEIMGSETSTKPFIGISGATINSEMVETYNLIVEEGVLLDSVFENGGASDAGLRMGDIITEFDGKKIKSVEELQQAVASRAIGDRVSAKIIRNNQREIEVTIEISNAADVNPW